MRRRDRIGNFPARLGAVAFCGAICGLGTAAFGAAPLSLSASPAETAPLAPPCATSFDYESNQTLIEDVKAVGDNNWDSAHLASCASKVLARKGEDIIPALQSLMDTRQRAVEQFALQAVCGPGHTGATAVPYIEKRLREGGLSFAVLAYPTIACIGEGAQSLIPLLISKSAGTDTSFPGEADLAIETLGALYAYDPGRILRHLIRLLDQPAHAQAAARALEKIGRPARPAQEALRRNLAAAVDASRDETAIAMISALGSVGSAEGAVSALLPVLDVYRPALTTAAARALAKFGSQAAPAAPALVRRLNSEDSGPVERAADVAALIATGSRAPKVLEALIDNMRRGEDSVTDDPAAGALARVDPFPQDLAPLLVTAIEMREEGSSVRRLLEQALANTGTDLKPAVIPPHAARDIGADLAAGLWALTEQTHPIVLDDLVQTLHVDPNDYLNEGRPGELTLTRKRTPPESEIPVSPIKWIRLTGVEQSPRALSVPGTLPAKQLLELGLARGTCVAAESVRERLAANGAPRDVAIIQDYSSRNGTSTIPVDGDHSPNRALARASQLETGPGCADIVRIGKSFDPEYWNHVCPLPYDQELIDSVIVPALQAKFGSQFGTYDLEKPESRDLGPLVSLTFTELQAGRATAAPQSYRISLELDRCSRAVTNVSRFIP